VQLDPKQSKKTEQTVMYALDGKKGEKLDSSSSDSESDDPMAGVIANLSDVIGMHRSKQKAKKKRGEGHQSAKAIEAFTVGEFLRMVDTLTNVERQYRPISQIVGGVLVVEIESNPGRAFPKDLAWFHVAAARMMEGYTQHCSAEFGGRVAEHFKNINMLVALQRLTLLEACEISKEERLDMQPDTTFRDSKTLRLAYPSHM
jgi:hypothetical protein